ncbi:hypothetical protein [Nocardia tengchongensis]
MAVLGWFLFQGGSQLVGGRPGASMVDLGAAADMRMALEAYVTV